MQWVAAVKESEGEMLKATKGYFLEIVQNGFLQLHRLHILQRE